MTTKLDLALKEHPEDVAVIGTQRGNLFLAIGEPKKGRAALVDVLEKTPHLEAAKQLLVSYPRTQKKETGFICRAVTDTFEWGDPKFEFMQTCVNWSGAETAQAGLVWAHETDQRWFLARRSNQTVVQRQIETEPSKRSAPGWSTDLKRLLDLNE